MPKCGKKVVWQDREYEVTNQDILRQQLTLRDHEGGCCCVTMEELRTGQAKKIDKQEVPDGETLTRRMQQDKPASEQPRKQSGRGQRPRKDSRKPQGKQESKDQQAKQSTEEAPASQEAPQKPQDKNQKSDTQSKRKRRGRRRPRSNRKPGQSPNKQGD